MGDLSLPGDVAEDTHGLPVQEYPVALDMVRARVRD
jgi:hypothetical protein